ncbi:MDR family MFS transporter [Burkholderia sp. Ax-1719]|uniref:MDR family MFS transporter n=1 Tax=Burkholderia sp. Ax-1719 TaxID=2608334 RepID=UPI001423822B|nr:MDR family MFS transporter [Burkholderia sp. Ax-1719]NIE62687.1 MFS transporter [Burkholderia sp. Ax-1719]
MPSQSLKPETSAPTPLDEAPTLPDARRRRVFIGLLLAMFLGALDQSIVATALPVITTELGGLDHLTWVVTAFMLTSTISAPMLGKLSDLYGRKPFFALSVVIFVGASLLCGLAHSMIAVVLARGLQGIGAGGLMTLSQTLVSSIVPARDRPRYQGFFTGTFAVSSVAGPLLGGAITTHLSWRWIFLMNLPLGIASLLLVLGALPRTPRAGEASVDYVGAALITAGTSALLLLFNAADIPAVASPLARTMLGVSAIGAFALLYFVERRVRQPIIDLKLFRIVPYAACVSASGIMSFAMMGSLVFMPLYYQLVLGESPTQSGAMTLPQVAMMMLTSIVGGRFASNGRRLNTILVLGVGLECAGLVLLAWFAHRGASAGAFLLTMGVLGSGMGMGMSTATVIVQNSVTDAVRGSATATMSFVRSLGGSLGAAVSGGVMAFVLNAQLATLGTQFDVRAFLDHGLSAISALPHAQQSLIVEVYRAAIGASLVAGGVMMFLGFLIVLRLASLTARAKDRA